MSNEPWSTKGYVAKGMAVLLFGAVAFLGWSLSVEINGAIVATGQVNVEEGRQAIQHLEGGLVAEVHVVEGQRVLAGDPILTLDGTALRVEEAIVRLELFETLARMDRLTAEINGKTSVNFSANLREIGAKIGMVDTIMQSETALFAARLALLRQTEEQLKERQTQTLSVIAGREHQLEASQQQLKIIEADLTQQVNLLSQGLTEASRVSLLRREANRLQGEIGELEAGIAEARSSLSGFELERLRQFSVMLETAQTEMADLQPKEAELSHRLQFLLGKIDRLVLRAPKNGAVLDLSVHTVGGVISPATSVAWIVPTDAPLMISIFVDPTQIDRIHLGQTAVVRFPNFNSRTTPELESVVTAISADAITDPKSGRRYYSAELALSSDHFPAPDGSRLQPGMPVEAFIRTDARTPASFLTKPIEDYWTYAFREE